MNKRIHQIAKERGLASKDVIERLRAAGVDVKAASSNVDEDVALKVLGSGNGDGAVAPNAEPSVTASSAPAMAPRERVPGQRSAPERSEPQAAAADAPSGGARTDHKQRPTRDSLQGERAPGAAGGRAAAW